MCIVISKDRGPYLGLKIGHDGGMNLCIIKDQEGAFLYVLILLRIEASNALQLATIEAFI
jgi:hypothetical protein